MIRKIFLSALLAIVSLSAMAQIDSLDREQAMEMVDEYIDLIDPESPAFKIREVDFLIETCTDSLLRKDVAERLYDHYVTSNVMGDEEVAIHMYDRWFKTHEIAMGWDGALLNAAYFAEYNRQTLVGMKAPELMLKDMYNEPTPFPDLRGDARAVLFFYDVDCYKCRMELENLRGFLQDIDYPLDFYAVYTGIKGDMWDYFIDYEWNIDSPYLRVHHLWDPGYPSEFPKYYGITETPRMFLLDKDGTILGRRLNTSALRQMLDFANLQEDLYSRCPIGMKMPGYKVKGEMLTGAKAKSGNFRLRKADYVMFYTPSCNHCAQERAYAEVTPGKKLMVNLDELDVDTVTKLLDTFDLSVLPHIIHLQKGRVVEKYITFVL